MELSVISTRSCFADVTLGTLMLTVSFVGQGWDRESSSKESHESSESIESESESPKRAWIPDVFTV